MESLKSNSTSDDPDPPEPPELFFMNWVQEDGFVYGDARPTPSEKVLALDMDDTLIRTKTGCSFPKDETDWVFWHDKVVETVQEYHSKGYKIIIITNQGGVQKGLVKLEHIQKKIEMLMEAIGVPIQAFIATHKNYYRKPSPGLWKFMCENLNGGVKVDMSMSIFCGDAAGRPATDVRKADFESTDYKFALNCGLTFKTPEMLYHNIHEELPEIPFHPRQLRISESSHTEAEVVIQKNREEMIIFVGPPPSGKTTFYKNHLASDYAHINNKVLKTKPRCLKAAEKAMEEGKSVVIDSCSAHNENRKDYIQLAKKHGFTVRAFVFEADQHLSWHLNDLRVYNKHRNHHDSLATPKLNITKWFKEFVEPTVEEGFDSVEKIKFVPGPFENQHDEEMFFLYLSTMK